MVLRGPDVLAFVGGVEVAVVEMVVRESEVVMWKETIGWTIEGVKTLCTGKGKIPTGRHTKRVLESVCK